MMHLVELLFSKLYETICHMCDVCMSWSRWSWQCFLWLFVFRSPRKGASFFVEEVSSLASHESLWVAESEGLHLAKSVGYLWKLRGYQEPRGQARTGFGELRWFLGETIGDHWVIHWGAVQLVKSGPISPLHYRKYRILYNIIPWNSKTSTSKLHGQYPISILACFVLGWARQWFETCWNDQMRGVSQISPGQPHLYYSKPPKR